MQWGRILVGPGVEHLLGWDGKVPDDVELSAGQHWTWRVSFTDPAGAVQSLTHEVVLKGITDLVYSKDSSAEGYLVLPVMQWFQEPAQDRRSFKLSPTQQSLICQKGLYERTVFSTDEPGERLRLDFFANQRSDPNKSEG
ncbi:hypothetical protein OG689_43325 [Kitasatospora sp. NBC_00240]|uniref:hypothetical protein n=1 Tax=Kitasatospora sp. NBC_00240 TaxID=2903567 RepID=UPI00224FEF8F|nr:hypothetical protein [Kitasatospora sp. NBC_00240]MCX5215973.1 hypothetical protein [Kitasatospora sp. NBC_00240]